MAGPGRYDVVVVGVGGMGSAAVYHLAKSGAKVLGIEQFTVAHTRGSSHGLSRIIRLAYHEHPDYVPLLLRAYELWHELEQESGQKLLTITGGIDASVEDQAGYSGFARALESVRQHKLAHEVLTAEQVNTRFPGYQLPEGYKAVYQPQAGILASERCIQAHVAAARCHGAEVHEQEKVQRWEVEAGTGQVVVSTDRGQYRTGRIVFTAGAWIPALIPQLQDLCVVERQVVGWFRPRDPAAYQPHNFPVFIVQQGANFFYGFPEFDYPGMKIGKFNHLNQVVLPDTVDRDITADDEQALRDAVSEFFPNANGPMTKAATCLFTNTPDNHFIIDLHPHHAQVILCSSCSGHGFKFCSVIGEILCDLALRGSTRHNIDLHRLTNQRRKQQPIPYGSSPAPDNFSKL